MNEEAKMVTAWINGEVKVVPMHEWFKIPGASFTVPGGVTTVGVEPSMENLAYPAPSPSIITLLTEIRQDVKRLHERLDRLEKPTIKVQHIKGVDSGPVKKFVPPPSIDEDHGMTMDVGENDLMMTPTATFVCDVCQLPTREEVCLIGRWKDGKAVRCIHCEAEKRG